MSFELKNYAYSSPRAHLSWAYVLCQVIVEVLSVRRLTGP